VEAIEDETMRKVDAIRAEKNLGFVSELSSIFIDEWW
jgi:hypothetical protein